MNQFLFRIINIIFIVTLYRFGGIDYVIIYGLIITEEQLNRFSKLWKRKRGV